MYLALTRMPGESYRELCDVFRSRVNSLCLLVEQISCLPRSFQSLSRVHEACARSEEVAVWVWVRWQVPVDEVYTQAQAG